MGAKNRTRWRRMAETADVIGALLVAVFGLVDLRAGDRVSWWLSLVVIVLLRLCWAVERSRRKAS